MSEPPVVTTRDACIGVVGGGLMGSGIAQVAAAAGFRTICREVTDERVAAARARVNASLARSVERGELPAAERDAVVARLSFATALEALAECDVVIEAIVEVLDAKLALWRSLDAICPPRTIFASNTSSLSIASMAAAARGDRMIGMHFFNPVPRMPLVEVVRAITTSDDSCARTLALARALGKEPIVARDRTGFVVNRLLIPYLLDAIRALEQGVASVADIDRGMHLGTGHPMGPFTLLDFVGLDTVEQVAEIMFDEFREARFAPPPLLRRLVLAGFLGRKSGRGFYDWSSGKPVPAPLGL